MIQAPENNVFVKVDHKYIGNISKLLLSASVQNGATVDPVDLVNIVGEIVSLPATISNRREYEGFSLDNIRVGDKAIFSYLVIYNFIEKGVAEEPVYKNRVWWDGQEYFACDITNLFAVIRDGEIIMLNGYVMIGEFEMGRLVLPAHMKKIKGTAKTQVMHIGNPKTTHTSIQAEKGDIVYFNPMTIQKYQINEKKFGIIQQEKILGREVPI